MSQRVEKISSTLQKATQKVLSKGLADPRVKGLVTITRVDVSPDFSQATLYCSVTPHQHELVAIKGVQSAATWIRRQVAEKVSFRKMPKLQFELDEKLRREQDVLACIAEARCEDKRRAQSADREGINE